MNRFHQAQTEFLEQIEQESHRFAASLAFIDAWFEFTPSAFNNNGLQNQAHENHGSAKIFALAGLLRLSKKQTLLCFGEHYRGLSQSPADSHLNIRRLLNTDLAGIRFDHPPLTRKTQVE